VYAKKGCGQCHGVRSGSEGRAAPDLARIASATGFFDLGAAMWKPPAVDGREDARKRHRATDTLTSLEVSNGSRVHLHGAVTATSSEIQDG
jgi:hypothetical protein